MNLKKLLLLISIPFFLLTSKLKSQDNYTLMPDSSCKINYPFPTNRIAGIYNGSYSIKPTNEYSDTNAVKIESSNRIKPEIIDPILNDMCNKFGGFKIVRQNLESSLLNSITTDPLVLNHFNNYFKDNNLSTTENYSLRSLLKEKTAIAYFIKEEIPTDNSFLGKKGYVEYPHILFFAPDTTIPSYITQPTPLTELVKQDYVKKDTIIQEPKKEIPKKKLNLGKWLEKYKEYINH